MPKKFDDKKKAAILADYRAGRLSIPEICAKHNVSKNVPRAIACEADLPAKRTALPLSKLKGTKAKPRAHPPKPQGLIKPPKISPEVWAAMCAKRAHYLATVGPYPERVLYPERYGNAKLPAMEAGMSMTPQAISKRGRRARQLTDNARAS